MPKPVILLNDTTTHGGTVIAGPSPLTISGTAVACVNDRVSCPLCLGIYPILPSSGTVKYQGKDLATEGMKTACGAELIASQSTINV
ncbi:PAAR domain-containing protein [Lonsdalea quercina]|uniref:PAAR domain-containing protein n=1 Tax=Lonsdalea quercina TaxID=71657 RepID=UPI003975ED58